MENEFTEWDPKSNSYHENWVGQKLKPQKDMISGTNESTEFARFPEWDPGNPEPHQITEFSLNQFNESHELDSKNQTQEPDDSLNSPNLLNEPFSALP